MNPMMQPPIPGQQPMPQQPPQAAGPMPGQPPAGMPQAGQRGPQRVTNTEFNQDIQNILLSRIEEEAEKNPNFGVAIDEGISDAAALELALLLPELHPIFRAIGLFDGMEGGMESGPIQAPGGAMTQGSKMPQSFARPQMEENPMTSDSGVSRGLMG